MFLGKACNYIPGTINKGDTFIATACYQYSISTVSIFIHYTDSLFVRIKITLEFLYISSVHIYTLNSSYTTILRIFLLASY